MKGGGSKFLKFSIKREELVKYGVILKKGGITS